MPTNVNISHYKICHKNFNSEIFIPGHQIKTTLKSKLLKGITQFKKHSKGVTHF